MIVVSSGQISNTSNRPVMMSIPNQVFEDYTGVYII